MHGSPIIRACLVVAALLLLLLPLRCMTTKTTREQSPVVPANRQQTEVTIELTSSSTPYRFTILHLGREIWSGESPEATVSRTLPMAFPREGVDLYVEVEWSGETPSALKVGVTPEGGQIHEQTLWGRGSAADSLTFE